MLPPRLAALHARTPYLRALPFRAVVAIASLILANGAVWVVAGIVLSFHRTLISTAVLSWVLGLRHALDADHIAAIDLMTRRLVATGQKPATVGLWFSLGHSTIVLITAICVAATASTLTSHFDSFSRIGGLIGSSVSAAFLLLLGLLNCILLYKLARHLSLLLHPTSDAPALVLPSGPLARAVGRAARLVDRPWKMYPLGVLFGLGFDTSSEIALLGLSALQAARGTSLWLILLFPVLFAAGMAALDTTDGALMMSLYVGATKPASSDEEGQGGAESGRLVRDDIAVTYFSLVLTGATVLVAVVVGTLQALVLGSRIVGEEKAAESAFWRGVTRVGERYDVIGGSVCGLFVLAAVGSAVCYRPWRRWVDRRVGLVGEMQMAEGEGRGEEGKEQGGDKLVGAEVREAV
ncbi:NicO-domain-containing protein [Trichodelitschia bisporula]|uniref:Nickel/cobalt efflux system n=1 Tax=Trichodelitschia bisporula TaxID=703511 RepID=A0A6G1HXP0_9PEZI|nr:NicO-domain-containing protein [Trichodelitschia bisporula]